MGQQSQVSLTVVKTSDSKLLLQVPKVDRLNGQTSNTMTVYDTVDELVKAVQLVFTRELS